MDRAVDSAGGPAGQDIVLLHGMASSPTAWAPVDRILGLQHRVHHATYPGHRGGESMSGDARPYGEILLDSVERQLDAWGLRSAHLVGNSLGGWAALRLAERGRALSVTCLAPAGGWTVNSRFELMLTARFVLSRRVARRWLGEGRRLRASRTVARQLLSAVSAHPEEVPHHVALSIIDDVVACTALDRAILHPARRDLPLPSRTIQPTTIAWSAEDNVLKGKASRHRYRDLPGAEQLDLPGVGHVPMLDDPLLVAAVALTTMARAAAEPENRLAVPEPAPTLVDVHPEREEPTKDGNVRRDPSLSTTTRGIADRALHAAHVAVGNHSKRMHSGMPKATLEPPV